MVNKITRPRIYIWDRCFLKQDLSLVLERNESPYRRLSITIIISTGKPFVVKRENNEILTLQGAILGPNVERTNIYAEDSDLTIIDAFITTTTYRDLMQCIGPNDTRALKCDELAKTQELCRQSFFKELSIDDAFTLFNAVIYSLCDQDISTPALDSRIRNIIDIVEQSRADELSISSLAEKVTLSESRLRSLFKRDMHCTLSQYIRSVSFWKSIPLLAQGMNFTEVAHESGFHDLAHYSRTVSEVMGVPPSNIRKQLDIFF
ncbi:hypothetical protein A9Q81_18970 [Gammaproteobacteria bacterium 42_54_T18]|nr:hypothetical protein A9Q81_18970 [Gammaproteobacteria bacterium 42_54_T18]